MSLVNSLRSLRLLIIVVLVGGATALVDRYQTRTYQHMRSRADPRGQPLLQGESLQELAHVLLEIYPERPESNLLMGASLAEQARLQEARLYLEKALKINRRNHQLLFLYARLLLDLQEDPDTVKAVVEEIKRYLPRSREKIEEYFEQASKGKIRFENEKIY